MAERHQHRGVEVVAVGRSPVRAGRRIHAALLDEADAGSRSASSAAGSTPSSRSSRVRSAAEARPMAHIIFESVKWRGADRTFQIPASGRFPSEATRARCEPGRCALVSDLLETAVLVQAPARADTCRRYRAVAVTRRRCRPVPASNDASRPAGVLVRRPERFRTRCRARRSAHSPVQEASSTRRSTAGPPRDRRRQRAHPARAPSPGPTSSDSPSCGSARRLGSDVVAAAAIAPRLRFVRSLSTERTSKIASRHGPSQRSPPRQRHHARVVVASAVSRSSRVRARGGVPPAAMRAGLGHPAEPRRSRRTPRAAPRPGRGRTPARAAPCGCGGCRRSLDAPRHASPARAIPRRTRLRGEWSERQACPAGPAPARRSP